MSTYIRYPSSAGSVTEPLTLQQLLTLVLGLTSAGPVIVTVASGSQAIELVQGARLSFDGGTGAAYLASDGTNVVFTGLGVKVPAATGYSWTGVGNITGSGSTLTASGLTISAQQYTSSLSNCGTFRGSNTQTTASKPGLALTGLASNQANQIGVDLGVQTAWTGTNTQVIARIGYNVDGVGGGTFPFKVAATGKHIFYNSASNAADTVGTATLVGGTVTVATTAVQTGDIVMLTRNTPGGTSGNLSAPVASITDGTSFVINSDNVLDTSTVNWQIKRKA